jgi:hypothetical protein
VHTFPDGSCSCRSGSVRVGADVLGHVIEQLSAEFGDRIDPASIRRVATQEVALFENAKVRTHVQTIAMRLARARLSARLGSQDTREALAG